jgi:hypothetical protein
VGGAPVVDDQDRGPRRSCTPRRRVDRVDSCEKAGDVGTNRCLPRPPNRPSTARALRWQVRGSHCDARQRHGNRQRVASGGSQARGLRAPRSHPWIGICALPTLVDPRRTDSRTSKTSEGGSTPNSRRPRSSRTAPAASRHLSQPSPLHEPVTRTCVSTTARCSSGAPTLISR